MVLLCLQVMPSPEDDFIFEEIDADCARISLHKHGCCVMQKCIAAASADQRVLIYVRNSLLEPSR